MRGINYPPAWQVALRGGLKGIVRVAEGKMSKAPPLDEQTSPDKTRIESNERDIGAALRAAYDSAVNEDIPPEMLDLLSKLR